MALEAEGDKVETTVALAGYVAGIDASAEYLGIEDIEGIEDLTGVDASAKYLGIEGIEASAENAPPLCFL